MLWCLHHPIRYLIGQFLVQLLSNGLIQFSLKLPGRNPHRVSHLHQDKHGSLWGDRERAQPCKGRLSNKHSARALPEARRGSTLSLLEVVRDKVRGRVGLETSRAALGLPTTPQPLQSRPLTAWAQSRQKQARWSSNDPAPPQTHLTHTPNTATRCPSSRRLPVSEPIAFGGGGETDSDWRVAGPTARLRETWRPRPWLRREARLRRGRPFCLPASAVVAVCYWGAPFPGGPRFVK